MTDRLPPNLLALFAPRPPLRWVAPPDHAPEHRHTAAISGIAQFLPALKEFKDNDGYTPTESWLQRRDRKAAEHKAAVETNLIEGPKNYKPSEDPNVRGDAFKTLIVARLSYEADEQDLEREFGRYGPIERIRLIKDTHADEKGNKKRKPHRGYAFIVYDREKDMRAALDALDGIKIKDRRIKVDVERGRTVKGWKPRRLGGGLGGRDYTKGGPGMGRGGFGGPGGPGGFRGAGGFRGGPGGPGGFGGRDRDRGAAGGFKGAPRSFDRAFGGRGDRGDRGDRGERGDRTDRGLDGPPRGAPSGDRRGFGGFDSRDDRSSSYRERDYDRGRDDRDRDRDRSDRDRRDRDRERENRRTGSNMEPVRTRDRDVRDSRDNGGYRDSRDRDRDVDRGAHDDDSRKRAYDGPPPEETRKLRRYL